jgi:hypothetical protein
MARTVEEISQEMKANFVSNTVIQGAYNIENGTTFEENFSKVSMEGTFIYIISFSIWVLEMLFADHVAWIEKRAAEIKPGTIAWYYRKTLEFQFGDVLTYIADVYQYSTINTENQIIKLASVSEDGGKVLIKVAKLDNNNLPIPLATPELDAFSAYMKKIKFAGVKVLIVSRESDLLKIHYKVYVDAILINENGELISNTAIKPVEQAINNYIKNLPFNGQFTTTELTDKIQQSVGIINPVFEAGEVKYGALPFQALGDFYRPNAGHLKIDPLYPLSATITYIRQ